MERVTMGNEERWFLVYRGRIYSEELTFPDRDAALTAVRERNESTPGFSCLRIPYRMAVCEGCRRHLLVCSYDANARHLTSITWQDGPEHEETRYHNEQTSLIASWVYGD